MLVQKQAQEPVSKRMPTNVEATLEELRVCQESAHLIKGGAPSHWGICSRKQVGDHIRITSGAFSNDLTYYLPRATQSQRIKPLMAANTVYLLMKVLFLS